MPLHNEIRILDLLPGNTEDPLECSIRTAALGSDTPYETLSYVWGNQQCGRIVHIAGHDVEVTSNLYAALLRLRDPNTIRALWVDQLCINQWDDAEKAEQVNLMRLIYKHCSRCLIWLGEVEDGFTVQDAEAAFAFIRLFAVCHNQPAPDVPPNLQTPRVIEGASQALKAMMLNENPWWSRIWTVQEAVLPQKATFRWGPLSIPLEALERAAHNMCYNKIPVDLQPTLYQLYGNPDNFTAPVRGLDIARQGELPLDLLQRWRYREATDPRDKIYALMGLFPTMPFPNVQSCSYELSTVTLYARVTLDLIQLEGRLRPLIGRSGEPHVTEGLPTWAIDMVRCEDPKKRAWSWHKQSHRYKKFSADGNESFQWESLNEGSVLSLKGVFVDKIVEIGQTISEDNWGDISDDEIIDVILAWEEMLARFVERHGTHVWSLSRENAFWRTMLGDLIMTEFPVRRVEDADHGGFIDFCKNRSHNEVYLSVRDMVVNQAFFITESGYIGIGPPTVRARDQVWVIFGSQVPLILRQRVELSNGRVEEVGRNDYDFVGDAFVYGFMDGEAVSHSEGKQEVIILH